MDTRIPVRTATNPQTIECEAIPIERERPQIEKDNTQRNLWILVILFAGVKLALGAILALVLMWKYPKSVLAAIGGVVGWLFWKNHKTDVQSRER